MARVIEANGRAYFPWPATTNRMGERILHGQRHGEAHFRRPVPMDRMGEHFFLASVDESNGGAHCT